MNEGYLTARGEAFDVGNTTLRAILRMVQGTPALQCGGGNEWDCGNGSLMRILPLAFYLSRQQGGYELIEAASSVTHAHPRVIVACALYVRLAMGILAGKPLALSWEEAARAVFTHYRTASPALRAAAQWYRDPVLPHARGVPGAAREGGQQRRLCDPLPGRRPVVPVPDGQL